MPTQTQLLSHADSTVAVIKEFAAKAAKAKDTPIELSAAEQAEVEDELRAMARKKFDGDEAAALGWIIKAPTSVSPAIKEVNLLRFCGVWNVFFLLPGKSWGCYALRFV